MMPDQNQEDFETLRHLLALKRHEVPPPGYFNSLSSKICSRIEAREEVPVRSFWQRLTAGGIKPVLAYSFVFSVCSLIAYTVTSFFSLEPQPLVATDSPMVKKTRSAALDVQPSDYQAAAPWLAEQQDVLPARASAVAFPSSPSLNVNSLTPKLRTQAVNYQIGGN